MEDTPTLPPDLPKTQLSSFSEALLEKPTAEGAPSSGLSFWEIVATQTSFNTSGALVTLPFCIGRLGYVLGPLLLILWTILCLLVNFFVVDVALAHGCSTLGDVGRVLGGTGGRR